MKQILIIAIGWGFILWLIGYVLGFLFFAIMPKEYIGWAIAPIGTLLAVYIAYKKIKSEKFSLFLEVAIIWTILAIVLDYVSLFKALNATDYYKLDVYLYYILTFLIPLLVFFYKKKMTVQ